MVLQEGEPEVGLVRTISQAARLELRNEEGLSDQMRAKLDQLDEGTHAATPLAFALHVRGFRFRWC